MPSFPFITVDVFTSVRFAGNQLAVFPEADDIPADSMGAIAREFNFSETTFVLPPQDQRHTRRVRIFTPGGELPFAGHPTIGTAFVLAKLGEIPLVPGENHIVLEEGVGPVPVTIRSDNGEPSFVRLSVAKLPEFGPTPPPARDLARCVGLAETDLLQNERAPEAVSCGLPYLFIPLRSRAALARAQVRPDDFERVLKGYWADHVFLFCDEPERRGSDVRGRMFAPTIGVPEDPATGSACVALGGYLGKRDSRQTGTLHWVVEQGFEMGRPSILEVEVDKLDGEITGVRVGGQCVMVTRGELTL